MSVLWKSSVSLPSGYQKQIIEENKKLFSDLVTYYTRIVQFNRSVISDSATPWTAARQASLSITNSWSLLKLMSLSRWCHPTISSSVLPFYSCLQSFPASGPFQMSQFFTSGGQSIGVSASTSVLPMNTQDWSPLGLMVGSPCSPRDSQESSPTPQFKSNWDSNYM